MKRKDFLKKMMAASVLVGAGSFPVDALARGSMKKLVILHTNDVHSRIEPFPMDGGKFQGLGGFAQRSHFINKAREQNKNVLLLDSGDIWQGTPYFNRYEGALEFKLMSEMKYDAVTIGNHDFDNGIFGLKKQMHHASFPFLIANYDFTDTDLIGMTRPYKIFKKDDVKIGVFGIGIELHGLVPKNLYGNTRYLDPIATANATAARLRGDYKCDLVICLSHLGYKYDNAKISDVELAKRSRNIDLILGGHTHTFLNEPQVLQNEDDKKIIVNQVGWAGIFLGRIEYYFERNNKGLIVPNAPEKISD